MSKENRLEQRVEAHPDLPMPERESNGATSEADSPNSEPMRWTPLAYELAQRRNEDVQDYGEVQ